MTTEIIKAIAIPLILGSLSAPTVAAASEWQVAPTESHLAFQGAMMGSPVIGEFEHFSADIEFDPDDLSAARVSVVIDMASANTRHDERDHALRLPEWFGATTFPEARFTADQFSSTGPGRYGATGTLTIRGIRMPVELPFTVTFANDDDDTDDTARMEAVLELDRSDFGIGGGEWESDGLVAYEVQVRILLTATRVR